MSGALPKVTWSHSRAGQAQDPGSGFPILSSFAGTFDEFVVAIFPIKRTVLESIFQRGKLSIAYM